MVVKEQYQLRGETSREIAESVEEAIRTGALAPEHRLPTIRGLSGRLGVSPATVASAYRTLRERGLILAEGRRGTIVSPRPPLSTGAGLWIPPGVRDLRFGLPDRRLLPDLGAALHRLDDHDGVPPPSERNDPELIELAGARFASDGVAADRIAVTGGALDAIERILMTNVSRGDLVAVEDPCYTPILDLLAALGASPIPLEVDDEGILPDALASALARGVRALVHVPRAQNPTGAALTLGRASELRDLLAERSILIIEDDHADGIAGAEFVSLSGEGSAGWAVIRSVSKSLGPDLRLAVMAGDATTIARVEGRQGLGTGWVSRILQRVVVSLWKDPASDQLVARAQEAYAERRLALIEALAARGIRAMGRTGLNVWVPVEAEAATVEALLATGWAVWAGERFRLRAGPGIRVTVASLLPEEAPDLADDIDEAQRGSRGLTY